MRSCATHFNPRTPCGVRRIWLSTWTVKPIFQSTHPLRGATCQCVRQASSVPISIHAPLAGCDAEIICNCPRILAFQSTHPLRGATRTPTESPLLSLKFQSTHPLRGATANLTNSYPQICAKATKMDLLSEEKMRYGLPQTACVSHFRSLFSAKLQRFSARLPFALRS